MDALSDRSRQLSTYRVAECGRCESLYATTDIGTEDFFNCMSLLVLYTRCSPVEAVTFSVPLLVSRFSAQSVHFTRKSVSLHILH